MKQIYKSTFPFQDYSSNENWVNSKNVFSYSFKKWFNVKFCQSDHNNLCQNKIIKKVQEGSSIFTGDHKKVSKGRVIKVQQ